MIQKSKFDLNDKLSDRCCLSRRDQKTCPFCSLIFWYQMVRATPIFGTKSCLSMLEEAERVSNETPNIGVHPPNGLDLMEEFALAFEKISENADKLHMITIPGWEESPFGNIPKVVL